jgi:VanZ family protein
VRGRHGSPVDVAIDGVGALIGLWAWRSRIRAWTTPR